MSLEKQEKLTEKFKKRFQRAKRNGDDSGQKQNDKPDTPRTKTRKLLRHLSVPQQVRRTLDFHHVLTANLKATYQETRSEKERQQFSKLVTDRIIKRYRMQQWSQAALGFSQKRWVKYSGSRANAHKFEFECKCKVTEAGVTMKGNVVDF